MLKRGDQVPHFVVSTVLGSASVYSNIWQQRNLVLVALSESESNADATYVSALIGRAAEFRSREAECVITREAVPGLPAPGALVADRWGEIAHVAAESSVADLPGADELLEWVEYLQNRCPECEGEAK